MKLPFVMISLVFMATSTQQTFLGWNLFISYFRIMNQISSFVKDMFMAVVWPIFFKFQSENRGCLSVAIGIWGQTFLTQRTF